MPKETFIHLAADKRLRFIEAALEEFAQHNYETASITQIVKKLNIAKGSVYQYFEDKLDLWLFLKQHCEDVKLSYAFRARRDDFESFWSFFRAMYTHGIRFDLEQPLCSVFLYRVHFKESSAEVQPYLDSWKKQANNVFTAWVEDEKQRGSFDRKISTETIVHFLVTMGTSITALLRSKYKIDFDKHIKEKKPVYAKNKEALLAAVDELIALSEKALRPGN